MGKPIIGAMMIIVLLLTTTLIAGEYKQHRDALHEINIATRIAARSACLAIDYDSTAEKGYIVLKESLARSWAKDFFLNNLNRYKDKADESNLDIFIINDAPGNFTLYDRSHYFTTNGVAVGYHYNEIFILNVDETDDF